MALWNFAWQNLWRNGKRTWITLAAVALNTAILIATYALMEGFTERSIQSITNLVVGEVQVHAPKYLEDHSLYKTLDDPQNIVKTAHDNNIGAAPRSFGYGLVSHKTKSAGAFFWGVEPGMEREVFDLAKHIEHGEFLPDIRGKKIVLGKKLARSLNVGVGSELVLVVQAADGSLGNDLYTVSGILKAVGENIDRSAAILHADDMRELFVLGDRVHEIALNSHGTLTPEGLAVFVEGLAPGAEVKTWREILPMFSDMLNMSDVSMGIFGMIFFLAAGLGVMNTMLMATYERIHEFGVIKALGAGPWRIIRDVAAEAMVLAILSTTLGVILGTAGSYYLQVVGIDTGAFTTSEISFAGVAFDPVWRATLSLNSIIRPVITMWVMCLVASLYPAIVAARLNPVDAMTHV